MPEREGKEKARNSAPMMQDFGNSRHAHRKWGVYKVEKRVAQGNAWFFLTAYFVW